MSSARSLAYALALLGPLLVGGWTVSEIRSMDRVEGRADQMDRRLRQLQPDVLVLGSSLAKTNVVADQLAKELGLPRRNVVLLTLPNATAAHWYAILKNRVVAKGYQPRVVVMVGAMTTMVTPDILKDQNIDRLIDQIGDDEPVLAKKVFGTESSVYLRWLFARQKAGVLRQEWLDSYRDHVIGWVFGESHSASEGEEIAQQANTTVFADENMNYTLHKRQGTGLGVEAVETLDLEGLKVAEESLIPDIGALASEQGINVLFVRTPFPPSNDDNDRVPEAIESEAIEVMYDSKANYLDLRTLNMGEELFVDMRHMNRTGARMFTNALADGVKKLGLMRERGVVRQIQTNRDAQVQRSGKAASWTIDLSSGVKEGSCGVLYPSPGGPNGAPTGRLRPNNLLTEPFSLTDGVGNWKHVPPGTEECSPGFWTDEQGLHVVGGELKEPASLFLYSPNISKQGMGRWVHPGTTLSFVFHEPWTAGGSNFHVYLRARTAPGGESPFIVVSGERVPLTIQGSRVELSQVLVPPANEHWSLTVSVPEGGESLWIQNLALGLAPYTEHLIGEAEGLQARSVRVLGGNVDDTLLKPVFEGPPSTALPTPRTLAARKGLGMFKLPRYYGLSDGEDPRANRMSTCSPLVVLEDGVPLPSPHTPCPEVGELKEGRYCHAAKMVYFSATDGSNPADNGRNYTLGLDPTRGCDKVLRPVVSPLRGLLWVYPGDEVTLPVQQDLLRRFLDGIARVRLKMSAPVYELDEALTLEIWVDGERWASEAFIPPEGDVLEAVWELDEVVPPGASEVSLVVRNTTDRVFFRLQELSLLESEEGNLGVTQGELTIELPTAKQDRLFADSVVMGQLRPASASRDEGSAWEATTVDKPREVVSGFFEAIRRDLWSVSSSVLVKGGLGWWTPVEMEQGGKAFELSPSRKAVRQDCEGCFIHVGQAVAYRPFDGSEAPVNISLSTEFPQQRPGQPALYWTYPGTTATFNFGEAWRGDRLLVRVKMGVFGSGQKSGFKMPLLEVEGRSVYFEPFGEEWVATLELEGRSMSGWGLQIQTPEGGPFGLLYAIDVVDEAGRRQVLDDPRLTLEPVAENQGGE